MVLELVGLSPAHAHDDRSRYETVETNVTTLGGTAFGGLLEPSEPHWTA